MHTHVSRLDEGTSYIPVEHLRIRGTRQHVHICFSTYFGTAQKVIHVKQKTKHCLTSGRTRVQKFQTRRPVFAMLNGINS